MEQSRVVAFYDNFLEYLKKDYHRLNPRHGRVMEICRRLVGPEMAVLDIGCGIGITSKFFAELGAKVTAIDISPKLIGFARTHCPHPNITYEVMDVTKLSSEKKYDFIALVDVFEHVPRESILDLRGVLRKYSHDKTRIYLNMPYGKFQKFMSTNHSDKQQIIDETYHPDEILRYFSGFGFYPIHMAVYGIDTIAQYMDGVFVHEKELSRHYGRVYQ